jgi:hypothetical protein
VGGGEGKCGWACGCGWCFDVWGVPARAYVSAAGEGCAPACVVPQEQNHELVAKLEAARHGGGRGHGHGHRDHDDDVEDTLFTMDRQLRDKTAQVTLLQVRCTPGRYSPEPAVQPPRPHPSPQLRQPPLRVATAVSPAARPPPSSSAVHACLHAHATMVLPVQ